MTDEQMITQSSNSFVMLHAGMQQWKNGTVKRSQVKVTRSKYRLVGKHYSN